MSARSTVIRALEAIEDGTHYVDGSLAPDAVAEVAHLLEVLEDELSELPAEHLTCDTCGLRFQWPGQLADHRDRVHWDEEWKAVA